MRAVHGYTASWQLQGTWLLSSLLWEVETNLFGDSTFGM